ncbi:MAG: hypothetical protein ACI9KN_001295 [Gammaproteobacteria bacterium]|jgi:hypothetical protein
MKISTKLSIIALALLTGACGSGTSNPAPSGSGTISLKLTDSPIDNAKKVVVEFIGVEFRSSSADSIVTFDFAARSIDLLDLQGFTTTTLLDNQSLPVGEYDEIRLKINADEDGELDSFIELSDGSQHELKIPSGTSSGLKIKGNLTIVENSTGNFTVDFDVRRSIVVAGNSGKYLLKPVLRLTEDKESGNITGLVDASLLNADTCFDDDPVTDNAVYVFEGSVTPDDIDSSSDLDVEPVVTALLDDSFHYTAAFLMAGEYTIAFTCNAGEENIDTDNDLMFSGTSTATVIAGETKTVDLTL